MTWYRTLLFHIMLPMIASTSYSSSVSRSLTWRRIFSKSGVGRELEMKGSSSDTWKVGCVRHLWGSVSQIAEGDTTFSTWKGPMNLWSSFLLGLLIFKFLVDSITGSPSLYLGASDRDRSAYFAIRVRVS